MDAWVEVYRPDGTSERHRIEGEQATLGRSPTAGIPLVNSEELSPEHMLLAPRPDGCWVAVAEAAIGTAKVKGKVLTAAVVPWGTEIQVGNTKLRVTDKLTPIKKGKGVGSPVMILLFVLLPLVGWMLLSDPEADFPIDPGAPPPELFDEPTACAETGDAAVTVARDAAEAGSHKAERYPFDAQDGVEAVGLYATAQACYETGGRRADSVRIRRDREALARRLEEDYHTHRLRLERALAFERFDDALPEARALNALLEHRQGDDYVTWLTLLERRLQLMMDQALRAEE